MQLFFGSLTGPRVVASLKGHTITKALDGRFIREAGWRSPPEDEAEKAAPDATAKESRAGHYTLNRPDKTNLGQ